MSHQALMHRIRAEYLEMPGLSLTLPQAQRFCGADPAVCEVALSARVDLKFLWITPRGAYARLTAGADHVRPHPAKAALSADPRVRRAS